MRYLEVPRTVWHRPARAAHCVSRPVSGLASGGLSLRPHLPVLMAQWSVAVSVLAYRCVGSAGIAFLS